MIQLTMSVERVTILVSLIFVALLLKLSVQAAMMLPGLKSQLHLIYTLVHVH
jgi:hypothetical protein